LIISTLLCVVFAEIAARTFWYIRRDIPFSQPGAILYAYYPELKRIDNEHPRHDDEFFDILFLGGSVLNNRWGQVEQALREQLADNGRHRVRIFNLAGPAHTSMDSWLKYRALGDARFELVAFYHGINEVRANNAPPEIFRANYSHYSWYETVNTLAAYHHNASFALPYTMRWFLMRIRYFMNKKNYVPRHLPRKDWLRFGENTLSAVSFKDNLEAIYDLSCRRSDRILLMTFATYLSGEYSYEAFSEKQLDYSLHLFPTETWGKPEHVRNTVAIHNKIIRAAAAQHSDILFVDQAAHMAGTSQFFNDVCHFTIAGSSKFAESMLEVILAQMTLNGSKTKPAADHPHFSSND
jgi:hypothetical protein